MEKRHENAIRANMVSLNKDLIIDELFLSYLTENRILTDNNIEEILNEKTKSKKATTFVLTLKRRGPKAFPEFIRALVETSQDHLALKLDRVNADRLIAERNGFENPERSYHSQESQMETGPTQQQPASIFSRQQSHNVEDEGPFMSIKVNHVNANDGRIKSLLEDKHVYPIKSRQRGRAVIINNEYFLTNSEGKKLSDRDGTQFDLVNLDQLLQSLHFSTVVYDNKTKKEILDILGKESKHPDHAKADAFIMCLLSHGAKGYAYGRDGEKISIDDEICAAFDGNNCPNLSGKPKIIIMQACQGKESTTGVPRADDDGDASVSGVAQTLNDLQLGDDKDSAPKFLTSKAHEKADMLVAYSTVSGYKSWRRPDLGSWFIRSIVEVFARRAHEDHIVDLLTRVRARVAELQTSYQAGDLYVQITKTDSTLTKNFYFFPGYLPS